MISATVRPRVSIPTIVSPSGKPAYLSESGVIVRVHWNESFLYLVVQQPCPMAKAGAQYPRLSSSLVAVGFVEAARIWGGQMFDLPRTKLSHTRSRSATR